MPLGGNTVFSPKPTPFTSVNASATSPTSVKKKQTSTAKQLNFDLFQAPPGPYRLTKAVTLPGERQTYGIVQGAYPGEVKNPYSEHGLTKAQALKRLEELNASGLSPS